MLDNRFRRKLAPLGGVSVLFYARIHKRTFRPMHSAIPVEELPIVRMFRLFAYVILI